MKKLLMGLGLVVLLAGCASRDNGMGGTGDELNQSVQTGSASSTPSDQFLNGTASPTVAPSGSQPGQGVP
jgi:hypothetical protein